MTKIKAAGRYAKRAKRLGIVGFAAAGLLFGLTGGPQMALAANPSKITLSTNTQIAQWSGTVNSDGPRQPEVPECVNVSCDKLLLKIKLPNDTFATKTGGVLVAIRFINGTPDDSLQLAVYNDNNQRVGSSTAQVGTAQALLLNSVTSGNYTVYVVDSIAYGSPAPSPVISYEGLTQVRYNPDAQPSRDLLPDLIALPQTNITFDEPFPIFDDPTPPGSSCHQSEIDEHGASVCLRFDQNLANIGEGALDIRFQMPTGTVPVNGQTFPVSQRIYNSTGSFTDVPSGNVEWHELHQHYHFQGFAQSALWAVDGSGNRIGASPVATGDKVSFCIADTSINPNYWGILSFAAQTYPAPNCLNPESVSGGFDHFKQGMSAGWSDQYNWFLPGQYIEVSGVANGDYILDTHVDPNSRLAEVTKANNCNSVRVRLTNMGTATPHAELLGNGPACAL